MRQSLPIDPELPRILKAIEDHDVVLLTATPGAGKTTRIPAELLKKFKKILVIEPRRVACISSAQRIADENKLRLIDDVGYEVRFDRQVNAQTKITLMTDGLFLRKLHQELNYDVIILDEFHERTISYDLILGLLKENLELGMKFKLVLMSATFSEQKMKNYFQSSQLKTCFVEVLGQVHKLTTQYSKNQQSLLINDQFFQKLVLCVEEALHIRVEEKLQSAVSSILVFLPGSFEIDQASKWISQKFPQLLIHKLHGQLGLQEQKDVILFTGKEQRIILSTNIAESSLTIQNVDCVIDSGLQKISRYQKQSGLTQLSVEKISLFSSKQRAGRAARLKSGLCFKMWTHLDEKSFDQETEPEILRSDLSESLLFLFSFGIQNPTAFYWLDSPDLMKINSTLVHLRSRGFIDDNGKITDKGNRVLQFPFDFDKSLLLIEAELQNQGHLAALLVSHLEGKSSPTISDPSLKSDIFQLLTHGFLNPMQNKIYQQTLSLMPQSKPKNFDEDDLSLLLLRAWPHHLCRRREAGSDRAKHFSGLGTKMHRQSSVLNAEYFIAVSASENQNEIQVRLAHGVEKADVLQKLGSWIVTEKKIEMNLDQLAFYVQQRKLIGKIEIDLQKLPADFQEMKRQLQNDVAERFSNYIQSFDEKEQQEDLCHFYQLSNWVQNELPQLIQANSSGMKALPFPPEKLEKVFFKNSLLQLSEILISSETSFQNLFEKNWWDYFEIYLNQEFEITGKQLQDLLSCFPNSLKTTRGNRKIQYLSEGPTVEARLQEFFGMKFHPTTLKGALPLRLVLLGPHNRPVQTTSNLISFWKTSYPEIRKELRGQYPKHAWPDDPVNFVEVIKPRYK
ncbi:MAG: ATP-dependent helicase C-terminal domain-containing protein [Pseudobdellovibrionaceae bacterium]